MEQNNKTLKFATLNKEPTSKEVPKELPAFKEKSKKSSKSQPKRKLLSDIIKTLDNVETIPLSKGVSAVLFKNKGVTLNSNSTLKDVIEIESKYPEVFVGLLPDLFKDFIVNDTIESYVEEGDIVTIKRQYCMPKGDIPRKVQKVYFKALNDMTVIIALLEDGDLALTNTLIKCK